MDEVSAVLASSRSQIEDEVRAFEDVKVVFNDNDRMPLREQGVERIQKFGHVVHVQPRRGFVKHKQACGLDDRPARETLRA